jgi:exodeoxyribonuclease VII large subunit
MEIPIDKIFSISEFIELINIGLKSSKAKIVGEVGQVQQGPTGHVYFSMKDERGTGMLNCIMWKSKYQMYGIRLQEGMKIVANGNPEVYAPQGRFSFICDTIQLAGEGELKKQYDELKKKLEGEGIFAPERKREIPKYPQRIGVITAKQGAVIHDFLNNVGKFGFDIKFIDSRVEGQEAVEDLLASIKTFRKKNIDVLVIIRGGGSMESLMAFNNELLVREVVNFPVPVIAGIGHDKDVPLVAMAADVACSTPTAVANLLNESWEEALLLLERQERAILGHFEGILRHYKLVETRLKIAFQGFKNSLQNARINLENATEKHLSGFKNMLTRVDERLKQAEKIIMLNNPERQLKLGYSIATVGGKVVRTIKDAKVGDDINVRLKDGIIETGVKKINPNF